MHYLFQPKVKLNIYDHAKNLYQYNLILMNLEVYHLHLNTYEKDFLFQSN